MLINIIIQNYGNVYREMCNKITHKRVSHILVYYYNI